jgi:hypothetical protein
MREYVVYLFCDYPSVERAAPTGGELSPQFQAADAHGGQVKASALGIGLIAILVIAGSMACGLGKASPSPGTSKK